MKRLSFAFSLLGALGFSTAALAQDDIYDPLEVPDEGDSSGSYEASSGGGGSASASASADSGAGTARGIGVGAQAMLQGAGPAPAGISVVYDPGQFHIEGILGFHTNGATAIGLGARGYYHIHQSTAADFSLGGGIGFSNFEVGPDDSATVVNIEGGAQIRVFVVPNVSLSASLGLTIATADGDGIDLTGNLLSAFGVAYFF